MNFRQRVAWLSVIFYLTATFAFFYYLFELNEHYNHFAVDHIEKFHSDGVHDPGSSLLSRLWGHLTDVPLTVWFLVLLVPYLQVFLMLLACTRADPRLSLAYMWPGLVYQKYQQICGTTSVRDSVSGLSLNGQFTRGMGNGHNVIHT
ncbi:hypothetical protein DPMN_098784 [Dreissena polymorpha]|uniref:Lysosomal enzyme trafficking factor n=1 Tax=Dreissena polymorpha TaxID=45954 RepID=A0A9D4R5U0_DREPO|nr:hypothetical protein DPMN_098784 [Dreissena polymorpha]